MVARRKKAESYFGKEKTERQIPGSSKLLAASLGSGASTAALSVPTGGKKDDWFIPGAVGASDH